MNCVATDIKSTTIQRHILGLRVDATSYEAVVERIIDAAKDSRPFWLCPACVQTVIDAHDISSFGAVMRTASVVTPDGMPLVWALRLMGASNAQRVYGPTLMEKLLAAAEKAGVPVGFYGSSPETIRGLRETCTRRWPELNVAFTESPPYRPATPHEAEETIRQIAASGARLMFASLGCPKQEIWAHHHCEILRMPIIVVGAAFDFLSGVKPQAPLWIRSIGLEWLFRLATEPRRLWRRYLLGNPKYVFLLFQQLLNIRRFEER